MSTFKQKNVIKSYKLRLQEKLKTVTEETENATSFLNSCVEEFRNRVQQILEIKDGKCLSLYKKLNQDLESFSEKLFILQTSFGEGTEDESDSSEDEVEASKLPTTQPKICSSLSSQNVSQVSSCLEDYVNIQKHENRDVQRCAENVNLQKYAENVSLQIYTEKNVDVQRETYENASNQRSLEGNMKYNCQDEDSNITDDDFYSLNSDNVQNTNSCTIFSSQSHGCNNELVYEDECESNISISQNSYRSISSNISEPLAIHTENKRNHIVETSIMKSNDNCSLETLDTSLVIQPPDFDVLSNFSGTLSCIVDPSNFWIQIENSHASKLSFSKSENINLKSLSSIKKGSYCLAPFKLAPFYYRAQSLSDGKSENEFVKVFFIDHGSIQEILVCDLRPLPKSAYKVSAQAIHCYLYGIVPTNDSWSHECIKRFKYFQNFCIEVVVKSKDELYGVELIAKLSAELNEDFSTNIAQSLCLDGLAMSLDESQSSDHNQHYESQLSDPLCSKNDSSSNISGSYDINAISNDSGVSVTSAYKASQVSNKRSENCELVNIQKVSEDHIRGIHGKNILNSKPEIQDLILFGSYDALSDLQKSNEGLKSTNKSFFPCCQICRNRNFCFHLKVPPPSLLFVQKDMFIVMVSHIVCPDEFYVNMAMENIDTLDDLREHMTSIYETEKNLNKINISDLTENMFCAGRFNADGYWYRVKIMQISPEDKKRDRVLCQYIDYGNTAMIQCCDLRPLTTEFAKHPSFAVKCSLAGIKPIKHAGSDNHSSYWEDDAITCFKKLTSYERCLTAQIHNELFNKQNDVYPVLLWDTEDSHDLLINAQLAEHKMAVFDYNLSPVLANQKEVKKSQVDIDSWDPMKEEYFDTDNNYALNDEDIEVMTTGYQAKDEDYTCKYFAFHGYCPRGANCNYKHLPLLESGVTHDQEEVYCLDTLPISDIVNYILVRVSTIITPMHFYVVLPFGCKTVDDIDSLVHKGSSYDEIINSEAKTLFYAIDKHYSNTPFNENTTIALSCGTIVAAKRKWDEKWHRGRIVEVLGINESSKVFFVDSGDYEWVPRKFIRTILQKFLHTPFQAVQCSLYGIEPIGSEKELSWSSEAVNYFKGIVAGEILLAEIIQRFGHVFHVSLRKTSQNDHSKIAERLVSAGFAQNQKVIHSKKQQTVYVPG